MGHGAGRLDPRVERVPSVVVATLRRCHDGDEVTAHRADARALDPDEHFPLLEISDAATNRFGLVIGEAGRSRFFSGTDGATPLQVLEFRVAKPSELGSEDECRPG